MIVIGSLLAREKFCFLKEKEWSIIKYQESNVIFDLFHYFCINRIIMNQTMEDVIYSKGAALIIGINEYDNAVKLTKAVNDAKSIADALQKLNFSFNLLIDSDIDTCDATIEKFISELDKYDVGIFYFAGHGVEIDGKNYLLAKNTAIENKAGVIRYSINLQEIVTKFHESRCNINIFIIDACRDNPYPDTRAFGTTNLAPMFAPKGTIIAYSTSPGERAKDGGLGNNSVYTGALLKHINEPGLPIEEFFKRVRSSVYTLSKQQQTSWEHTSLIGNFSFNSGQLIHSLGLPYAPNAIKDKDFDYSDPLIGEIVKKFKSYNYYTQNSALDDFERLHANQLSDNQMFIIGRNILQAAVGGCWQCQSFIRNRNALERYTKNNSNHLLNGILFEMYFDSEGHFRYRNKKGYDLIDSIVEYHNCDNLKVSFAFINKILLPFSNRLLFYPSETPLSVSLNILTQIIKEKEIWEDVETDVCYIEAIKYNNVDLLVNDGEDCVEYHIPKTYDSEDELKNKICEIYAVPYRYLTLTFDVAVGSNPIKLRGKFRYL